jgi:hypothetical protein
MPDDAHIKIYSPHVLDYLLGADQLRCTIESTLEVLGGKVTWPEDPSDAILIQCTLDQNAAKTWKDNIEHKMQSIQNSLDSKVVSGVSASWKTFKQKVLGGLQDYSCEKFKITFQESDKSCIIAGSKKDVATCFSHVKRIRGEVAKVQQLQQMQAKKEKDRQKVVQEWKNKSLREADSTDFSRQRSDDIQSVQIKIDDPHILDFLLGTDQFRHAIEMDLQVTSNASVVWPGKPTDSLIIQRSLPQSNKEFYPDAWVWKNNLKLRIDAFLRSFDFKKVVVPTHVWEQLKQQMLRVMQANHCGEIKITFQEDDKCCCIVGTKDSVATWFQQVEDICREIVSLHELSLGPCTDIIPPEEVEPGQED